MITWKEGEMMKHYQKGEIALAMLMLLVLSVAMAATGCMQLGYNVDRSGHGSPASGVAQSGSKGGSDVGKVWTDPTTGMEFVWIPTGCYTMGSPPSESFRGDDEYPHQVCVEAYWLAKYEVTNSQYRLFKPSHDSGAYKDNSLNDNAQPVVEVSWNDAMAFAAWLSQKSGKTFKLPTEGEWEYAARAGTQTAYYWGDDYASLCRYANISDRSAKAIKVQVYDGCDDGYKVTAPVGRFVPNAWGLYDMLGNVGEWTSSLYDAAYSGDEHRAAALGASGHRVYRGRSWVERSVGAMRVASRNHWTPGHRYKSIGFRLASTTGP